MNGYFKILSRSVTGNLNIMEVELNPDAQVYEGHFPGNPISPGVCNIAMIRDCASEAAGRRLDTVAVSRCRFLNLVTPEKTRHLRIELTLEQSSGHQFAIQAKIYHGDTVCVDFKGSLAESN